MMRAPAIAIVPLLVAACCAWPPLPSAPETRYAAGSRVYEAAALEATPSAPVAQDPPPAGPRPETAPALTRDEQVERPLRQRHHLAAAREQPLGQVQAEIAELIEVLRGL